MSQKYFYILFILTILFCENFYGQNHKISQSEVVNFYPNPVTKGKIFITAKTNVSRDIEVYDVLGKKIFQSTQISKEVNVSNVPSGIYVIKIREGDAVFTRKLIVK